MSVADRFTDETSTAATALSAMHTLVAGVAPDSTAGTGIQDPGYLAHALSQLRYITAEVEFILHGLHRRVGHAAHHDAYPATLRDLCTTLATDLRAAVGHAHATWRVMSTVENHGDAIKAATRGTPATVTTIGDRFAEAVTTAANALGAAHTILAGLSQREYGGRAVLNAAILTQTLSLLRQITATLQALLRVLGRHAQHLADNPTRPDMVRERAAALAADLSVATAAARGMTPGLHRLAAQARDIQDAARGITFAL